MLLVNIISIFGLFQCTNGWLMRENDDYDRYEGLGIYRPSFGQSLVDRIIRARDLLHSMQLQDQELIHSTVQVRIPPTLPPTNIQHVVNDSAYPWGNVERYIEISFLMIVAFAGLAAFYIIKNRAEELWSSKASSISGIKHSTGQYGSVFESAV
jgi:hypothetical protein